MSNERDAALDLPQGYSAWTGAGEPVRRCATNRNPLSGQPPAVDFAGVLDPERAALDAMSYGDAWVTLDGRRVAPCDVVVNIG
jgi:hypothetical protein